MFSALEFLELLFQLQNEKIFLVQRKEIVVFLVGAIAQSSKNVLVCRKILKMDSRL